MHIARRPHRPGWEIAARQVIAKEEVDAVVVEHVHR